MKRILFKRIYGLVYHQCYYKEIKLDSEYLKQSYNYFFRVLGKHILPFFVLVVYFFIAFTKPDTELLGANHTFNVIGNVSVNSDAFFIFMPLALMGYWLYLSYLLIGIHFMNYLIKKVDHSSSLPAVEHMYNLFLSPYFVWLFLLLPIFLFLLVFYAAFPVTWIFDFMAYGMLFLWLLIWLFSALYCFCSNRLFWLGVLIIFLSWVGFSFYYTEFISSVRSVYLFGQEFKKQDFRFMNLTRGNLVHAIFINSDLHQAVLSGADMSHTIFKDSDLTSIQAVDSDLTGSNLSGSNLVFANLLRADLEGVNLSEVKMRNTNLQEANMAGSNFTITQYQESCNGFFAKLDDKQIKRFGLPNNYKLSLKLEMISDFLFLNANFCSLRLQNFVFVSNNMSDANFSDSKLSFIQFLNNFMNGIDLSNAYLHHLSFSDNSLFSSRFRGSFLSDVDLEYSNLSGASFLNSKLYNVSFKGSDLLNVDFKGAHLVSVDFRGAKNLDCKQFEQVAVFRRVQSDLIC